MSFNPRSRKGNDGQCAGMGKTGVCFNPRSRKGNDQDRNGKWHTTNGFNPRSRKGNDISPTRTGRTNCRFQSTFPQGERQKREFYEQKY